MMIKRASRSLKWYVEEILKGFFALKFILRIIIKSALLFRYMVIYCLTLKCCFASIITDNIFQRLLETIMEQKLTRENFSRKRTAILKTLQETTTHPTANWVYSRLRPRYPNLSLGTVYRNLKKLCETGKAHSVGVVDGQEHFDGNIGPHSHLICENCGAIHDIHQAFFSKEELMEVSDKHGHLVHVIHDATVVFKGFCTGCRGEKGDIVDESALPGV